jgi:hypothetical protein
MRAGLALAILIGTTWTALAGDGFDIVIPGRPGVPVIINGIDASYAVVEGDWGLGKSIHVQPTVYGGRYVDFAPSRRPAAGCRSPRRAGIDRGPRSPPRSSRQYRFIRRR